MAINMIMNFILNLITGIFSYLILALTGRSSEERAPRTPAQIASHEEKLSLKHLKQEPPKNLRAGFEQMRQIRGLLGLNRYHQAGYTGNGVIIGMIDNGVGRSPWFESSVTRTHRTSGDHATHVAGIIDNCAPSANIVSYNAFDRGYSDDDLVRSLHQIYTSSEDSQPDIVNISMAADSNYGGIGSFGKHPFGDTLMDLSSIYELFRQKGILLVIASGNMGSVEHLKQCISCLTQESKDCKYTYGEDVPPRMMSDWPIIVSSCTLPADDGHPRFSEFNTINKSIHLVSYGEDILSFKDTPTYAPYVEMSGTSMATPQVTGCLAVLIGYLKDAQPGLTKIERAQIVRDYALHKCTIRDVRRMLKTIKLPREFTAIDAAIVRSEVPLLPIKRLLEKSEYMTHNPQFTVKVPITRHNCVDLYQKFRITMQHKFAILSLGHGILSLPSDTWPYKITEDEHKLPFDTRGL